MLHVIVAGALLSLSGGDGAIDGLAKSTESIVTTESYTFRVTTKSEGDAFPGTGDGAPAGADEPVVGEFQKSHPIHLKRGSQEVYRTESETLYKGADGKWQTLDRRMGSRRGGSRGGRGEGGGSGSGSPGGAEGGGAGGEGGDAAGGGQDDGNGSPGGARGRRGRAGGDEMAASMLSATAVPHRFLADIRSKVEDVTAEPKDGKTVYSGKLTKTGAQELGGGGAGSWRRNRDSGGKEPEFSGTFRVITDAAGQIERIEIDSKSKFFFGDEREVERSRKTTIEISNVGKTHLEVPKDVETKLKSM